MYLSPDLEPRINVTSGSIPPASRISTLLGKWPARVPMASAARKATFSSELGFRIRSTNGRIPPATRIASLFVSLSFARLRSAPLQRRKVIQITTSNERSHCSHKSKRREPKLPAAVARGLEELLVSLSSFTKGMMPPEIRISSFTTDGNMCL
jgi:hypothetical protein